METAGIRCGDVFLVDTRSEVWCCGVYLMSAKYNSKLTYFTSVHLIRAECTMYVCLTAEIYKECCFVMSLPPVLVME